VQRIRQTPNAKRQTPNAKREEYGRAIMVSYSQSEGIILPGNSQAGSSLRMKTLTMKLKILGVSAFAIALTSSAFAADYKKLADEGYRWVNVDGPYACTTELEVHQITGHRTDTTEMQMSQDLKAYYLIPGSIVQVLKNDSATKMSQIQIAGITQPLWTYTRFLSVRPIVDTYGDIETPENSGLIPTADTGVIGTQFAGPAPMPTPAAPITSTDPGSSTSSMNPEKPRH
jgi:hypothetical protein